MKIEIEKNRREISQMNYGPWIRLYAKFRYKDGNFNLHLFKPWYNNYKVESFFRLKLKISLTTEPIESSFLGSRRLCDGLRLFYFLINFLKYFKTFSLNPLCPYILGSKQLVIQ